MESKNATRTHAGSSYAPSSVKCFAETTANAKLWRHFNGSKKGSQAVDF